MPDWNHCLVKKSDGRLKLMLISQPFNIQENAIRPFIIDRENWLFTASESSAHASAAIYGLIETCRANERVPYHYLRHFQKSCIDQVPLKTMKTCRPEILMEGLQWFPDWLTRVWFINRLPSTSLKILNIQNMPSLFLLLHLEPTILRIQYIDGLTSCNRF